MGDNEIPFNDASELTTSLWYCVVIDDRLLPNIPALITSWLMAALLRRPIIPTATLTHLPASAPLSRPPPFSLSSCYFNESSYACKIWFVQRLGRRVWEGGRKGDWLAGGWSPIADDVT